MAWRSQVEIDLQVRTEGLESATSSIKGLSSHLQNLKQTYVDLLMPYLELTFASISFSRAVLSMIETLSSYELTLQRVRIITADTSVSFKDLERTMVDLAKYIPYEFGAIASAMYELADNGWKLNEGLQDVTKSAMELAYVSGIDLAQAASMLDDLFSMFGMSVTEANQAVDVLIASTRGSKDQLSAIGEALKQTSVIAQAAGLDFTTLVAIFKTLHEAGYRASRTGFAMREALESLMSPSAKVEAALSKLGLQLEQYSLQYVDIYTALQNIGNAMQGNVAPVFEAFGSLSGQLVFALANNVDMLKKFDEALRESGDTSAAFAQIMTDTVTTEYERFKRALDAIKVSLARDFLPALQALTGPLSSVAKLFTAVNEATGGFVSQLLIWTTTVTIALTGLVRAFRTLYSIVSVIGTLFASLAKGFGVLIGSITAFLAKISSVGSVLAGLKSILASIGGAIAGVSTAVAGLAGLGVIGGIIAGIVVIVSKLVETNKQAKQQAEQLKNELLKMGIVAQNIRSPELNAERLKQLAQEAGNVTVKLTSLKEVAQVLGETFRVFGDRISDSVVEVLSTVGEDLDKRLLEALGRAGKEAIAMGEAFEAAFGKIRLRDVFNEAELKQIETFFENLIKTLTGVSVDLPKVFEGLKLEEILPDKAAFERWLKDVLVTSEVMQTEFETKFGKWKLQLLVDDTELLKKLSPETLKKYIGEDGSLLVGLNVSEESMKIIQEKLQLIKPIITVQSILETSPELQEVMKGLRKELIVEGQLNADALIATWEAFESQASKLNIEIDPKLREIFEILTEQLKSSIEHGRELGTVLAGLNELGLTELANIVWNKFAATRSEAEKMASAITDIARALSAKLGVEIDLSALERLDEYIGKPQRLEIALDYSIFKDVLKVQQSVLDLTKPQKLYLDVKDVIADMESLSRQYEGANRKLELMKRIYDSLKTIGLPTEQVEAFGRVLAEQELQVDSLKQALTDLGRVLDNVFKYAQYSADVNFKALYDSIKAVFEGAVTSSQDAVSKIMNALKGISLQEVLKSDVFTVMLGVKGIEELYELENYLKKVSSTPYSVELKASLKQAIDEFVRAKVALTALEDVYNSLGKTQNLNISQQALFIQTIAQLNSFVGESSARINALKDAFSSSGESMESMSHIITSGAQVSKAAINDLAVSISSMVEISVGEIDRLKESWVDLQKDMSKVGIMAPDYEKQFSGALSGIDSLIKAMSELIEKQRAGADVSNEYARISGALKEALKAHADQVQDLVSKFNALSEILKETQTATQQSLSAYSILTEELRNASQYSFVTSEALRALSDASNKIGSAISVSTYEIAKFIEGLKNLIQQGKFSGEQFEDVKQKLEAFRDAALNNASAASKLAEAIRELSQPIDLELDRTFVSEMSELFDRMTQLKNMSKDLSSIPIEIETESAIASLQNLISTYISLVERQKELEREWETLSKLGDMIPRDVMKNILDQLVEVSNKTQQTKPILESLIGTLEQLSAPVKVRIELMDITGLRAELDSTLKSINALKDTNLRNLYETFSSLATELDRAIARHDTLRSKIVALQAEYARLSVTPGIPQAELQALLEKIQAVQSEIKATETYITNLSNALKLIEDVEVTLTVKDFERIYEVKKAIDQISGAEIVFKANLSPIIQQLQDLAREEFRLRQELYELETRYEVLRQVGARREELEATAALIAQTQRHLDQTQELIKAYMDIAAELQEIQNIKLDASEILDIEGLRQDALEVRKILQQAFVAPRSRDFEEMLDRLIQRYAALQAELKRSKAEFELLLEVGALSADQIRALAQNISTLESELSVLEITLQNVAYGFTTLDARAMEAFKTIESAFDMAFSGVADKTSAFTNVLLSIINDAINVFDNYFGSLRYVIARTAAEAGNTASSIQLVNEALARLSIQSAETVTRIAEASGEYAVSTAKISGLKEAIVSANEQIVAATNEVELAKHGFSSIAAALGDTNLRAQAVEEATRALNARLQEWVSLQRAYIAELERQAKAAATIAAVQGNLRYEPLQSFTEALLQTSNSASMNMPQIASALKMALLEKYDTSALQRIAEEHNRIASSANQTAMQLDITNATIRALEEYLRNLSMETPMAAQSTREYAEIVRYLKERIEELKYTQLSLTEQLKVYESAMSTMKEQYTQAISTINTDMNTFITTLLNAGAKVNELGTIMDYMSKIGLPVGDTQLFLQTLQNIGITLPQLISLIQQRQTLEDALVKTQLQNTASISEAVSRLAQDITSAQNRISNLGDVVTSVADIVQHAVRNSSDALSGLGQAIIALAYRAEDAYNRIMTAVRRAEAAASSIESLERQYQARMAQTVNINVNVREETDVNRLVRGVTGGW